MILSMDGAAIIPKQPANGETRMNTPHIKIGRIKPIPFVLAALIGSEMDAAWSQAVEPEGLESIIVTAQRRAERLQDVPVSVKAFSAKQIADTGIVSTQDFINLTPNMSFDNSFTYRNSFVVIRGVTQVNNADSPIALVVDGVPQNNQKQLKMNLFDVERIEVLRGPQGALYGRNAIGGVINIETKKPQNRFESFIDAGYGSGNVRDIAAGVSGPIADDKLLFRLAGQSRQSDGLIRNTYLNQSVDEVGHDNSLRGRVVLLAADGVQFDFRASVNHFSAGATWDSIVRSGNPNDLVDPRSNMQGKSDGKVKDFSFKAALETGVAAVTAITAYTDLSEKYRGDIDFSNPGDPRGGLLGPLPFQLGQGQNLSAKMFSQEVQLTSPGDKPLRWILGGYYLKTRRDLETRAFIDSNSQLAQWDDLASNLVRLSDANDNRAYAAFGLADYDIAAKTTLSGALRYDRDDRDQVNLMNGANRHDSFAAWQPKVTLTRHYGQGNLSYATYSTGFRSGGFNAPGLPVFQAENLRNVELGFKSTLLNNRLIFNVATFYSQSTDFQFFYVDAASASQIIGNIDKVDIKGVDFDFRFLPSKVLELDGGLGIADSRIRQNAGDPGTVGNYTPKATPWKLNLGLQYTAPVATGIHGFFRLDYEHRSKRYWHPDNAAVSNALDLIGLRIGLREMKDKWSVNLFGRNLTNKKYYADYNAAKYSGGVVDIGSLAPQRTLGVAAKIRF